MIFRSARWAAGSVALALIVAGCGGAPAPQPRTVRVERASVSTGVSATGSLSSSAQNNLGFPRGGQLTAVGVKVGDVVRAGQVLATIDDFPARQGLRQAQAGLAGQQANLDRAEGSTGVQGAENSRNQADRVVTATKRVVDATLRADDRAVDQARAASDKAVAGAQQAQAQFQQLTAACAAYQAQAAASGGAAGAGSGAGAGGAGSTGGAGGTMGSGGSTGAGQGQIACTLLPGAQSAATMAQSGIAQATSTVQQARNKRDVDAASGKLQIEQARTSVVQAQNGVDSSSADRSPTLDAARSAVAGARVAVTNAQRDLANTTLRAPVDGRITALNGAVGEFVAPSSATTPSAPGADAPIPGAGSSAGAGAGAGGAGGAAASPSRPGGAQFLVMQGVSGFSVVAPFQESDATKIAAGQPVELSLDALPDATLAGTVTSVAPSSTEIASVINYYATIAVNRPDTRLRDGQTARASVITGEARDMLSVPNSAVVRQGDRTSVVVLEPDGRQVPTPFSAGLVGADRTEVTGGLPAGAQVLVTGNR